MSWNLLWKAPLYGLGYPIAFVVSCAVVTACICPVASGYAVIKGATAAWEFIHPSFEDAITCGYKRPIPGLKLCQRCRAVKNSPRRQRVEHHGDLNALKASSQRGCWACQKLCEQYERFVGDGSQPPAPHMEDLISPLLLLWYSKHVTTKSGYLDDLDTKVDFNKYAYNAKYGTRQRDIQPNPLSSGPVSIVNAWLEMCTEQHSCYHGEMSTLPTRVIDVGKEQPCLHLSNGAKAPYITLSHCWGELETITTTKSTLEARMSGFSMESLPKLFQDAVKVTRLLNIHYLWIDSLCIIQDSHEEWSSESARMGDIYRCSFLTLYALDAANSHETMLGERASLTPDNARISDTALLRKQYFQKSTLYKRAWALQERLLSPRILYYSNKEMLWECLECTARESTLRITPFHLVPYSRYTYECLDVKKRLLLDPGPQPSLPLLPHKDWHIIVVEYTRCRLTKDTDKLPALSGIAAIFQRNTGFTYLAGLWKEDITSGLLWYVAPTSEDGSNEKQSFSQYIAPSWSWASSNSPVGHPTVTGPEIRGLKFRFSDLELLDFSITRLDANPMGEITQAFITVRAFRKPSYYKKLHAPHEICGIFDEYGKKWGRIVLDAQNYALRRGRNDERIPCMAVWVCHGELKSFDVDRPVTELLYFLVVIEDPDQEWAWRRVGLGQTYDGDAAFRGCQKVEMKLV